MTFKDINRWHVWEIPNVIGNGTTLILALIMHNRHHTFLQTSDVMRIQVLTKVAMKTKESYEGNFLHSCYRLQEV